MKKFLFVFIMLMIIPCVGYADDGRLFDVDGIVSYSVKMDKYECELGGTVDYTLLLKNLISKELTLEIMYINGTAFFLSDNIDNAIDAGKTGIFEINDIYISPDYQWYPKEDGYYLDIYHALCINENDSRHFWINKYWNETNQATSLKIKNLKDGSDLIEVTGIDEIGFIDYYEDYLEYNESDYPIFNYGTSTQTVQVKNISGGDIQIVTSKENDVNLITLGPHESEEYDITVEDYNDWEEQLEDSKILNFRITLIKDGEYYGVKNLREYKARYFFRDLDLKFDVTQYNGEYESIEDQGAFYKIEITNKGDDIPEFKYYFDDQNRNLYSEEDRLYDGDFYNYGLFKHGEVLPVYIRLQKDADIFGFFASGKILTNTWEYYALSDSSNETEYKNINWLSWTLENKQSDLADTSDEEQAEEETNDAVEKTEAEDQEEKTLSREPIQTAEVVSVETKSSMPTWVGIVLGISLVSTIGIIVYLRKKQG